MASPPHSSVRHGERLDELLSIDRFATTHFAGDLASTQMSSGY